jgi:hypothetical protein
MRKLTGLRNEETVVLFLTVAIHLNIHVLKSSKITGEQRKAFPCRTNCGRGREERGRTDTEAKAAAAAAEAAQADAEARLSF